MRGLVIGLTGKNCAGKDSVAAILEARGFERHSLSDALREELKQRGAPISRDALRRLGTALRAAEGAGVLAERMKCLVRTERAVLVSVRNPTEVASLRRLPHFLLLGVDAPLALRFQRERQRGRERAAATLAEFVRLEEEENTADPNAQQLDTTLALADEVLTNDGTLADLERKVVAYLEANDG